MTRQALDQLSTDLAEAAQKLETSLTGLLQPFESEAIRALVRQCESSRPGPELAEEVELILATPFPAAEDRARLWKAGLVLDRRLGELDFGTSGSTSDASGTMSERRETVRELAARRVRRLSALLQLAGPGASRTGRPLEPGVPESIVERRSGRRPGGDGAGLGRTGDGLEPLPRSARRAGEPGPG